MKRAQTRLRVFLDHAQQGFGRAFGFAPALFPVLERPDAHPYHAGELALGEAEPFPHRLDIDRAHHGAAVRDILPAHDRSHLLNALHELLEVLVIHVCMFR